tara:strand:+ start:763 stop:1293 length:531 start_codon:yes stop_codon:yes gene_type:complete
MLLARRNMSVGKRRIASEVISEKIIFSNEYINANLVACYLPMIDEVDIRKIIEHGWRAKKRIFLPKIYNNDEMLFHEIQPNTSLSKSKKNIWEPVFGNFIRAKELQLVITPTVAYDKKNNRIGMGQGYYDKCFSFLRDKKKISKPKLIGAAFHCQKIEKISVKTWDIRLFQVFSEK